MVIDSHHHFWKYDPIEYRWISNKMKVIRRSFSPGDLKAEIDESGIDGVVSVQARQTVEETDALLEYARENDFIKVVVGWLPLAEPQTKVDMLEPWKKNIQELSKRDNVTSKISGMVTEADYGNWSEDQLRPYLDTVLEAFGTDRLMFGSDWPVCLVACGYKRWHDIIRKFIAPLSAYEQEAIMGGTAVRAYYLNT